MLLTTERIISEKQKNKLNIVLLIYYHIETSNKQTLLEPEKSVHLEKGAPCRGRAFYKKVSETQILPGLLEVYASIEYLLCDSIWTYTG